MDIVSLGAYYIPVLSTEFWALTVMFLLLTVFVLSVPRSGRPDREPGGLGQGYVCLPGV